MRVEAQPAARAIRRSGRARGRAAKKGLLPLLLLVMLLLGLDGARGVLRARPAARPRALGTGSRSRGVALGGRRPHTVSGLTLAQLSPA